MTLAIQYFRNEGGCLVPASPARQEKMAALFDELTRLYVEALEADAAAMTKGGCTRSDEDGGPNGEGGGPITAADLFESFCDNGEMPWDDEITNRIATILKTE